MDAPLHAHWPKLILWAVSEAILLALTLLILTTSAPGNVPLEGPGVTDCTQREWNCHFTGRRGGCSARLGRNGARQHPDAAVAATLRLISVVLCPGASHCTIRSLADAVVLQTAP